MGNAVKKGMKQVSLKNVIKLGTPLLGSIPILGGVAQSVVSNASQAHDLKKESVKLAQLGKIEESNAMALQAEQLIQTSGAQVGQQVGTQFNAFTKSATNEMKAQISSGTNAIIGGAGATVVDLTIKEWLSKHFTKMLVLLGLSGIAILYFKNRQPSKKTTNYRKRY